MCIFSKIFNPVISPSTRNDREISDSRRFTKAGNLIKSGIGTTLAYEAKFINKKVIGITRYVEKVNSKSVLLGNPMKKDKIDFTSEIVEKVYEFLPLEQKYIIDEVGNVLELDPVGVVRTALEIMDYQLDPAWYSWGTIGPRKIKKYNYEFQQFLDQVADVLHITRTKLISNVIDNTHDSYQKVKNSELLDSNDIKDLVLEIVKNIYYSLEANGDKQVIFALCDKFLEDTGNPLGSLGIYFNDLQYYQYFKRAQEVVEVFSKVFEPQSLSNKEARLWYVKQETKIKDLLDSRIPLKLQAVQAFYLRNCLRIKTRELMKDRRRANALMKTERNYRWDEIVLKYKSLGYKGNALWDIIIESSMKSRPTVNKYLGISEWMVYPGQNWQEYF